MLLGALDSQQAAEVVMGAKDEVDGWDLELCTPVLVWLIKGAKLSTVRVDVAWSASCATVSRLQNHGAERLSGIRHERAAGHHPSR